MKDEDCGDFLHAIPEGTLWPMLYSALVAVEPGAVAWLKFSFSMHLPLRDI